MSQPPEDRTAHEVPTCYRHPDRETWIRCQRCDRPICPDCMNDASVGFQCASCVKEGHRDTRQLQGRFGGKRVANPTMTSMVLIGINVVVWLAINATGRYSSTLLEWLQLSPAGRCVSTGTTDGWYPGVNEAICSGINGGDGAWRTGFFDGAWWQPLTSAFTHVEVWHLGMNMLVLWFLGPQIEAALGRTRFLAVYLLAALGGSVGVLWWSSAYGSTVGASGAIWGLLGALLVLALKARRDTGQDNGAVRSVLTWIGINVVFSFAVGGISWQAHFGGLIAGIVATAAVVLAPRQHRTALQWGTLGVMAVVLVGLMALRVVVG
ncbi:MAG: rhomboid family intramembrane serine protease [Nocardioides sp.]|uniref:rhomboid family intramembrane serine protease n=1 Tax=Nocardioides sp. TaxID=35761 RepID=UPI003F071225